MSTQKTRIVCTPSYVGEVRLGLNSETQVKKWDGRQETPSHQMSGASHSVCPRPLLFAHNLFSVSPRPWVSSSGHLLLWGDCPVIRAVPAPALTPFGCLREREHVGQEAGEETSCLVLANHPKGGNLLLGLEFALNYDLANLKLSWVADQQRCFSDTELAMQIAGGGEWTYLPCLLLCPHIPFPVCSPCAFPSDPLSRFQL